CSTSSRTRSSTGATTRRPSASSPCSRCPATSSPYPDRGSSCQAAGANPSHTFAACSLLASALPSRVEPEGGGKAARLSRVSRRSAVRAAFAVAFEQLQARGASCGDGGHVDDGVDARSLLEHVHGFPEAEDHGADDLGAARGSKELVGGVASVEVREDQH